MKTLKKSIAVLVGIIFILTISACSKKEEQETKTSKEVTTKDTKKEDNKKADSSKKDTKKSNSSKEEKAVEDALEMMGKMNQWPKEELPKAMPELTKGKVVNWGANDGEVIIKMKEVAEEAIEAYKNKLEDNGWRVDQDSSGEISASYDLYELSIKYSETGDVQLWLTKGEEVAWPTDLLPEGFPKFAKGKVGNAYKDDELGLVYVGIEGAKLEDALEYAKLLIKEGWEGSDPVVEEGQEGFNVQLSKGDMFLDFDYYYNADGCTLQVMKQ